MANEAEWWLVCALVSEMRVKIAKLCREEKYSLMKRLHFRYEVLKVKSNEETRKASKAIFTRVLHKF